MKHIPISPEMRTYLEAKESYTAELRKDFIASMYQEKVKLNEQRIGSSNLENSAIRTSDTPQGQERGEKVSSATGTPEIEVLKHIDELSSRDKNHLTENERNFLTEIESTFKDYQIDNDMAQRASNKVKQYTNAPHNKSTGFKILKHRDLQTSAEQGHQELMNVLMKKHNEWFGDKIEHKKNDSSPIDKSLELLTKKFRTDIKHLNERERNIRDVEIPRHQIELYRVDGDIRAISEKVTELEKKPFKQGHHKQEITALKTQLIERKAKMEEAKHDLSKRNSEWQEVNIKINAHVKVWEEFKEFKESREFNGWAKQLERPHDN